MDPPGLQGTLCTGVSHGHPCPDNLGCLEWEGTTFPFDFSLGSLGGLPLVQSGGTSFLFQGLVGRWRDEIWQIYPRPGFIATGYIEKNGTLDRSNNVFIAYPKVFDPLPRHPL